MIGVKLVRDQQSMQPAPELADKSRSITRGESVSDWCWRAFQGRDEAPAPLIIERETAEKQLKHSLTVLKRRANKSRILVDRAP
jgi:hypothetical protein